MCFGVIGGLGSRVLDFGLGAMSRDMVRDWLLGKCSIFNFGCCVLPLFG